MTLFEIDNLYKSQHNKLMETIAVVTIKEIHRLFCSVNEIHPGITEILTGNWIPICGWTFSGSTKGFSKSTEKNDKKIIPVDADEFEEAVNNGCRKLEFTIEEIPEMKLMAELLNFLVDSDIEYGLNYASFQYGIAPKGVIFLYSDTKKEIPTKVFIQESSYYKALINSKVPVVFVCKEDLPKKD